MDQVTQQNAAMVEESTAASQSMSQEAAGLSELVAQFQLRKSGSGQGAYATHPVAQPSAKRRSKRGATPNVVMYPEVKTTPNREIVQEVSAPRTQAASSKGKWQDF